MQIFECKRSPKSGNILGYFCLKQVLYIFILIQSFKAWLAVSILRVQKWFDVDILDVQIEVWCKYYGIFGLVTFCHFFKNFGDFFRIF